MSVLSIRLPDSLHQAIKQLAIEDHTSINQFVIMAVSERISALTLAKRIERDANLVSPKDFKSVLKKVPNIKPEPKDQL
jgi:hypothetical protein